jgi:DNA-binding transcriptional ArsR family regulator
MNRISDAMLKAVAQRFRVLGEPIRLQMLQFLETGEKTVSQVVEALELNQPVVSRHLGTLFDAGILERRREGNSIYYSIGDPLVHQLCDLMCASAREHARGKFYALGGESRPRARR